MMRRLRQLLHGQAGMGLVELLVASMLSVFMLALIGTLFIRAMRVNTAVRATTTTTNQARLQFDSIQEAIRLAVETDVRVGTAPSVVPAGGAGDVLIVKSRANQGDVTAASTWRCMGWYLSPDGTLRAISGPAVASGSPVTGTDPSTWPVVVQGVTATPGHSAFVAQDPDVNVESWYPGSVTVSLHFESPNANVPVSVMTTVSPRRQLQLDGEIPGGVACPAT